jgi:hypothetical protein
MFEVSNLGDFGTYDQIDSNGNLLHTCESATASGIKAEVIGVVYQLYLRVRATHLGAVRSPAFRQKVL